MHKILNSIGTLLASVLASIPLTLTLSGAAPAQSAYPVRPITYIVPYPPGGVTDTTARAIAAKLSEALKQPVVVENRPGAGGIIGTAQVAKAPADGYTLLHATLGVLAIAPHINKIGYDPLRDFAPVANMVTGYTALVVNRNSPISSVADLLAYAKRNPGKTFYASSGQGGITHIMGELFKAATGQADIIHVPYKGASQALVDLIGGRVDFLFDSTPVERVNSGQVKALAAMGPRRFRNLPAVPTIYEAGVANFKGGNSWLGVMVPADTPREIINRLSTTLMAIALMPDFAEKMSGYGVEVTAQDAATFGKQIREDFETYGAVIRAANITAEGS